MQTSIMLAQILGPYCIIAAIGLFFGHEMMKKAYQEFFKSPALLYLAAAMALLLGLFIIGSHNIWVQNWTVLITLAGWMAVIKGTLLMVFPDAMLKMAKAWKLENKIRIRGVIVGIVGVLFTYYAYFA